MRQVTATEKYRAVNEGKLSKRAFVTDMRMAHPSIISQWNSYDDTVQILKNKGFISEKSNIDSYDSRYELNISSDSIDRGVRYELQAKGIDPTNANQEDFDGVKNKVIKNLKKDPLHYILLVSGESNKVNKNDKPKEVKRGAADKDTFNDLKKATLKEEMAVFSSKEDEDKYIEKMVKRGLEKEKERAAKKKKGVKERYTEEQINTAIERIKEKKEGEKKELPKSFADQEKDQIEKDAMKAKGMIKETIDKAITAIQKQYPGIKGLNDQIVAFLKIHYQDILDGADPVAEFDNYVDANYDRLDEKEAEVNEYRGSGDEIKAIIRDRAADSGFSEQEEAQEVMEFIGQEYEIDFEFGAGPSRMAEKKGKDHDGDGDIDSDDYLAAKDKAIKKAMGKDEVVRESLKNIITKVLEEQVISEAATNQLAGLADTYGEFEGFKQSIIQLQDIVTDIESYYDKTRNKIQKVYDSIADIRNDEGLKVGAFLAPSIEAAFNKDLRPVMKTGFTKGLETPKVKMISKSDVDAARAAGDIEEEPKQTMFTPVNENEK